MPPVHPAADILPMMSAVELAVLAEDIGKNGQIHPVVLCGSRILDGRNRWRACEIAGVEPKTTVYGGDAPVAYAASANVPRRHLTPTQKASVSAELVPLLAEEARHRKAEAAKRGNVTRHLPEGDALTPSGKRDESKRAVAQAAKATGAGVSSVKSLVGVKKTAPEVFDLVKNGKVKTVSEAKQVAALDPEQRADVVQMVKAGAPVQEAIASIDSGSSSSVFDDIVSTSETVAKKANALHRSCVTLRQLCKSVDAEVSSPTFAVVKTRLLRARSELTKTIILMNGDASG